jgi:recombination protein RecT
MAQINPQLEAAFAVDVAKRKNTIEALLPAHMDYNRLTRSALMCIQKVPQLLDCKRDSLMLAIVQSAQWGLELGIQCHLIPFKDDCVLVLDFKGVIDLMYRTGAVKKIQARAVFTNDEFKYSFGLNPELSHTPALKDPGEVTHWYAVVDMLSGAQVFDVMSKAEVDAIKAKVPAVRFKRSSPWTDSNESYIEMGKKTVIKRVSKVVPFSTERAEVLNRALIQDTQYEIEKEVKIEVPPQAQAEFGSVVTVGGEGDKSDKLADQLNQEAKATMGIQPTGELPL